MAPVFVTGRLTRQSFDPPSGAPFANGPPGADRYALEFAPADARHGR
jgi:hypothetical protein